MKPSIGIPENKINSVIDLLSEASANEVTLDTKTRKFHWSVSGKTSMERHKLFENHYKQLEESINIVVECTGNLLHKVINTMEEFGKLFTVKEHSRKYPSSNKMKKELLTDHETMIVVFRKSVDDCTKKYKNEGKVDFKIGLMKQYETLA
jgi:starvation-inducible DNA-binding protein